MVRSAAVMMIVALSSGCMTFNGKEIRRPEVAELQEPYAIIALEVTQFDKLMNGKREGFGANFNEGALGRAEVAQIARIWKSERLIREFGWPGDLDDDEVPTHRMILSGTSDEVGSLAMAFLTGLTFYLLPSSATVTTDIDVTLRRLADGAEFTVEARNSVTLWQQIIFLPTSLLGSLVWGTLGAQTDRSLFLYDEFDKAGAFEREEPLASRMTGWRRGQSRANSSL